MGEFPQENKGFIILTIYRKCDKFEYTYYRDMTF